MILVAILMILFSSLL